MKTWIPAHSITLRKHCLLSLVSWLPHPPVTCGSGLPIMIPSQRPAPTPTLCLPDEDSAQDEDDETHDARRVPPVGLVALGACKDRPVAKVGHQVRVAIHKEYSLVYPLIALNKGWEDPLEKGMATHSSILAWRIPWTEEPGRINFILFLNVT